MIITTGFLWSRRPDQSWSRTLIRADEYGMTHYEAIHHIRTNLPTCIRCMTNKVVAFQDETDETPGLMCDSCKSRESCVTNLDATKF